MSAQSDAVGALSDSLIDAIARGTASNMQIREAMKLAYEAGKCDGILQQIDKELARIGAKLAVL